jgi:hypothetical protein
MENKFIIEGPGYYVIETKEGAKIEKRKGETINCALKSVGNLIYERIFNSKESVCARHKDGGAFVRLNFGSTVEKFETEINGSFRLSEQLNTLGINQKDWHVKDLAKLIRFNSHLIGGKTEADELFASLMKFSFQSKKDIETESDNRGNAKALLNVEVKTSLPGTVNIHVPIETGNKKVHLLCEIDVMANGTIMLVCPDLNTIIEEAIEQQWAELERVWSEHKIPLVIEA